MKALSFYIILSALSLGNLSSFVVLNDMQPLAIECPECNKEFENCSDVAHKAYTAAVENAADSINSKSSRFDYRAACAEARKTRDKVLEDCRAVYHKCCLAEMEKNKKGKEEQ